MSIIFWIIICVAAFILGGVFAGYVIVVRVEKGEDRLLKNYLQAIEVMENAYENPSDSNDILESFFKGMSGKEKKYEDKIRRRAEV